MSAMKAWAMSWEGEQAALAQVDRAQAHFDAVSAAAALAAPHVDAATLDDLTFEASHALGEAYEVLAVSRGYEDAHHWARHELPAL